ncbi:MAG: sulfate adenylyltransferase [Solirubrobacteraceae bacterium]
MSDNAASPHGGKLVERVLDRDAVSEDVWRLPQIPVRGQIATECIDIAYGFLSPLEGFMGKADVDTVVREMRLANGLVWSVPIIFDLSDEELAEHRVQTGETYLLTHRDGPLATFEVEEIYAYDKQAMAQGVYGSTDSEHPGVRRTQAYADNFLAGKVTLLGAPTFNAPYDQFFRTPRQLREYFAELGWKRIVAFQTRNVPHVGHEWLMKGAWFQSGADGILDNPVIGEKKEGDAIDEAILHGHQALIDAGYFKPDVHMVSSLLWDMRYAGPREAVFHALVRKNLGCTHHAFGRDHAGVGSFYDPYAAHRIFDELPDLGIEPVITQAWGICEKCGPAYARFCAHPDKQKPISGTWVRGLIRDGNTPDPDVFRPEVFQAMLEAGERHGLGSPFVSERYLNERTPVFTLPPRKGITGTPSKQQLGEEKERVRA